MIRLSGAVLGIAFMVFGVLILVFPDLLRWLVGLFFIFAGILVFGGTFALFRYR